MRIVHAGRTISKLKVNADRLLAKSVGRDGWWHDSMLLPVHLADVHHAANEVLRCTGADQLMAVGLSVERHFDRFRQIVLLAAALHDLGKANDHFQEMLWRRRTLQGLRHEWVTLLMVQRPEWSRWLRPAIVEDLDLDVVAWAVAGHHPAYHRPSPPERADAGAGSEIRLLTGHPDFAACLAFVASSFALGPPPPCGGNEVITLRQTATEGAFARIAHPFAAGLARWMTLDNESKGLVAAAKACLVAADVAGSALPRAGKTSAWIRTALASVPPPDDLKRVVADRLAGKALRPFQLEVAAETSRVALARAACGSGKTLAAYQWAAEQCPGKRVYVCYPTTGTATEGFRDYLFDQADRVAKFGAELFHGRADIDRDIILGAGGDDSNPEDVVHRLQSLDAWATPIVSCTVDTVLGLVQNHKKGLYAWPALAQSAFVFDEIHAYDEKLFGALLRFLQAVRGVRVLLMTASLPRPRLEALQRTLKKQGEALVEIAGPRELESLPRYHRLWPRDAHDPLPEIRAEIARGGKVLWVCNLVDRAAEAASRTKDLCPLVYHSRFRYEDRVRQHASVIRAFDWDQNPGPALAVTTQVAEMSLDLSATLLVTDLAPVPAMIQRLGRLNRRAVPVEGIKAVTLPFIVVEPLGLNGRFTHLPYDTEPGAYGEWPAASREWLDRLDGMDISQADLAAAWESGHAQAKVRTCDSKWLDGGPRTEVDALRDASPSLTVILERDHALLKAGDKRLVEIALPMPPPPKSFRWRDWPDFRGVPVAPRDAIEYDAQRGATWRK